MEYLTKEEVLRVLASAKDAGPREHCAILLAYRHALRASEVCALTLRDVRANKINVRRLKNSLPSIEPLETHANPLLDERIVLEAWLRVRGDADGSSFLFTSRQGSGISRRQLHNLFEGIAAAAGIDARRRHMHILKHSVAMLYRDAGMDVFTMQRRLGHRDIKSTSFYVHTTVEEAATAAADSLAKVFA